MLSQRVSTRRFAKINMRLPYRSVTYDLTFSQKRTTCSRVLFVSHIAPVSLAGVVLCSVHLAAPSKVTPLTYMKYLPQGSNPLL